MHSSAKWDPEYDKIEDDECDYKRLVRLVREASGAISKDTFLEIWKWKGAMRVIRRVDLDQYDLYAAPFHRAFNEPPEQKLPALLKGNNKLPGVGAPTGSTIIHFMHPDTMPIIDVRTVETLHKAGRLSTKQRDLAHYEQFRGAIDQLRRDCDPKWTLRQIDRALFAYHKLVMANNRDNCRT